MKRLLLSLSAVFLTIGCNISDAKIEALLKKNLIPDDTVTIDSFEVVSKEYISEKEMLRQESDFFLFTIRKFTAEKTKDSIAELDWHEYDSKAAKDSLYIAGAARRRDSLSVILPNADSTHLDISLVHVNFILKGLDWSDKLSLAYCIDKENRLTQVKEYSEDFISTTH